MMTITVLGAKSEEESEEVNWRARRKCQLLSVTIQI